MGGCLNLKPQSHHLLTQTYPEHQPPIQATIIPLSHFYHLLRKKYNLILKNQKTPLEIISHKQNSAITFCTPLSPQSIDHTLKVIYDHKDLLIADTTDKQNQVSQFASSVLQKFKQFGIKPSNVLIFNRIDKFLEQYPFFNNICSENRILTQMSIPLLIFDGHDIKGTQVKPLRIYLHNTSLYSKNISQNKQFYSKHFGVQDHKVINLDHKGKNSRGLIQSSNSILIIHETNQQIKLFLKEIIDTLSSFYSIPQHNIHEYLKIRIPSILQDLSTEQIASPSQQKQKIQTKREQLSRLLREYTKESGNMNLTQEIAKLMATLLQNLTRQQNIQPYRAIKPTNAQLHSKIFQYKSGKQLIEAIGFYPKEQMYYNEMQRRDLLLFKTDLALAVRDIEQCSK